MNRELSVIKRREAIKCKKILWDNRWNIKFEEVSKKNLEVVPLGSLNYKKKELFDFESSDKGILDTLPAILKDNKLVFTPFSKLAYDIEVELLFGDKHLYKNF